MTCVGCGADLAQEYRFCPFCGASQRPRTCARCDTDLPAGAVFCPSCGVPVAEVVQTPGPAAALSPVSERRVTSVLFADLVGYTSLAEQRDTEDVRELLSDYFEVCKTVVRRYGGTIEKFIGDAVMAVWGVPAAHEDDAERAVRAGLELVDAVAELGRRLGVGELALRAGVVTGEVSTTVGATDQGMVAGDAVNTASRVQAVARPGQVWVDEVTRTLVAAVTFADVGEHVLKGKSGPMRLFRAGAVVASVGGEHRVDGLEAPLAGRVRELRLVKELFHATEESHRPRLVVLDGQPGIGKSRLAWEFFKYVDGLSGEVMWHQGRCLSYGDGIAYWALGEALRTRLGPLDEPGPAAGVGGDALDAVLHRYVPDAAERDWLGPRVASLLGAGGGFDRDDLFAAWTRLFERLAAGSDAVTLVIDDAQHADDGLLGFLEHLLANGRAAVFVLLLARPDLIEAHPSLGGRRASVIQLEPLPEAAMGELVDGLVAGLPAPARAELVERSDGVPLYAVETVRALIDRDLVIARDGRYTVADNVELDLSQVEAPASLHALVAARLDALGAVERRVVADASVLGLSFTRDGIGALAGDVTDLDAVLESLRHKEILATETDRFAADRGQFRFVQAVVRQVAYGTLSRRDRKRRHLQVAEYLAGLDDPGDLAVVIATHLLDAADAVGGDDLETSEVRARAVGLLGAAGARACALGANADGLRLFATAIEQTGDLSVRAGLQEQAAQAAIDLSDSDAAADLARAALASRDAGENPDAAARSAGLLGEAMVRRGELSAARELVFPRYQALLDRPGTEPAQLRLLRALSLAASYAEPASRETLDLLRTHLRLAEQLRDWGQIASALSAIANVEAMAGSEHIARALLRDLVVEATARQDWRTLARARGNLADRLVAIAPAQAAEHAEAALQAASEHGLKQLAHFAMDNLALVHWTTGNWARLAEPLTAYLEGSETYDPFDLLMMMSVDLWRVRAGLPALLTQQEFAGSDDPQALGWQHHLVMLRAAQRGDLAAALRAADAGLAPEIRASLTHGDLAFLWPEATRIALDAGDHARAGRLLDIVSAMPPQEITPALAAHHLLLRGVAAAAARADPAVIEADLSSAIGAFTDYDSPPNRARAHEELGRWMVAQGRIAEAVPHLDEARAVYTRLGASAWLARLADTPVHQPAGR
jgi:class 3 adenylate cyclase